MLFPESKLSTKPVVLFTAGPENQGKAGATRKPRTYLTEATATEAIVRYGSGQTVASIAAGLGVNETCIYGAICGRAWRQLNAVRAANPRPEGLGRTARIGVEPPPVPGARWIPLTFSEFALVDEADFDSVSRRPWYFSPVRESEAAYASTSVVGDAGTQQLKLHRFVWSLHHESVPPVLDHEDRDGLNCRLGNLRPATHLQNIGNRHRNRNNSSTYRGVSWSAECNCWRAQIGVDRKQKYIGIFARAEDAARAYDAEAVVHFGEFATLNFPAPSASLAAVAS